MKVPDENAAPDVLESAASEGKWDMVIPERYKTQRNQSRIFTFTCERLAARLPGQGIDRARLADYIEYALELIERSVRTDARRRPPKDQWSRPIVAVLETAYLLDREELRLKFLSAAKLGAQLIPWLDEEDLRSSATSRVLAYAANPINPPLRRVEGLFFTAARNLFRDLLRKERREQEAAREMIRRAALREREGEQEEARPELQFPPDEVRRALIPFSLNKLRQQRRSRRTRRQAAQRVRGFAMTVTMMIPQPQLSRDECRLMAIRRAAAINHRTGKTAVLVPPRATFYAWLDELNARVKRAHGVA